MLPYVLLMCCEMQIERFAFQPIILLLDICRVRTVWKLSGVGISMLLLLHGLRMRVGNIFVHIVFNYGYRI